MVQAEGVLATHSARNGDCLVCVRCRLPPRIPSWLAKRGWSQYNRHIDYRGVSVTLGAPVRGRRRRLLGVVVADFANLKPTAGDGIMALRFTGKYEELQQKLVTLNGQGQWLDLNENQKQFRHNGGGILNWYPSTGTINFQGRGEGRSKLEAEVAKAILAPPGTGGNGAPPEEAVTDLTAAPAEEILVDVFSGPQAQPATNACLPSPPT